MTPKEVLKFAMDFPRVWQHFTIPKNFRRPKEGGGRPITPDGVNQGGDGRVAVATQESTSS